MEREIQISGKEIEGRAQLSYSDGFIGAKLTLNKAPNTIVYRCYLQNAEHDTIYLGICEPTEDGLGLSVNVRGDEQFNQCLITIGRMDEAYQVAAFGEYEETRAEVAEIEDTDMEEPDAVEEVSEEAEIAQEADTGENSSVEEAGEAEAKVELEETGELEIAEDTEGEAVGVEAVTAEDDGAAAEEKEIVPSELLEEETVEFEEEQELDEIIKRPIGFDISMDSKCASAEEEAKESEEPEAAEPEEEMTETAETSETAGLAGNGVLDEQDECVQCDTAAAEENAAHTAVSQNREPKECFDYLGLSFFKCNNIMNEHMSKLEKQIFMYDGINYAFQKYGFVLRAYEENAVIYAIPSNLYKDPHPILHLALYTSYHNIRAFVCDGYFIIGVDRQKNCYFTVIDE